MSDSPSREEFQQLRKDFSKHEELDEARHVAITKDVTDLRLAQADFKGYIRGRGAAVAVILMLAIPILTEFAHAVFGPIFNAKP